MQPKISAELKARKLATLEEKAPQVIAAGNIGCMMQIGSGTTVPVVHTAELLDWATGGPKPRALGAA
jgi:glycolate oxidase iron-sulfur subunit